MTNENLTINGVGAETFAQVQSLVGADVVMVCGNQIDRKVGDFLSMAERGMASGDYKTFTQDEFDAEFTRRWSEEN